MMAQCNPLYANKLAKIALERAIIELEYAHKRLGMERMLPRLDTIAAAKEAARECTLALKPED